MANALYDLGREAFLGGDISWRDDTIKAILIDTAFYTVNLVTDQFLDDVPAGAREATSGALTSKTITLGVADAADEVFVSVPAGPSIEAIVIFRDTAVEATSELIAYIDTATNLPVTPDGSNITAQWDSGADKIFKL